MVLIKKVFICLCALISISLFFHLSLLLYEPIKAFVTIITVIFLPGSILNYYLFRNSEGFDVLENISIIFCLGVSFWVVPSMIGFRFQLPLMFFVYFLIFIIMVYFVLVIFSKEKKTRTFIHGLNLNWPVISFCILSFIFCIFVYISSQFHGIFFDTFYHIGSLRNIAQSEYLLSKSDAFVNGMLPLSPYIENVWYFVMGFISYLGHVEAPVVYIVMSAILSITAISAFYVLVKEFVKYPWISFVVTFLSVCFWLFVIPFFGAYRTVFQNFYYSFLPYPGEMVHDIIFPLAIVFYLKYLLNGKNSNLIASGLFTMAAVSGHASFAYYLSLIFLSCFVGGCINKNLELINIKRFFTLGSIFLLIVGIVNGSKYFNLKKASGYADFTFSLKAYATGRDGFLIFGDRYIMFDPLWVIKGYPFEVAGLLMLPLLFWIWRHEYKNIIILLTSILIVPLFIVFNPVLAPWISHLISVVLYYRTGWYSHNILFRVSLFTVLGIVVSNPKLFIDLKPDVVMRRFRSVVLFTLPFILLTCIFIYAPTRKVFINALTNQKGFVDIKKIGEKPLFIFLKEKVPANSVIASSQDLSYLIGAMTQQKTIAIMSIRMSDYEEGKLRIADVNTITSFKNSKTLIIELLKKYNCRYIIIDAKSSAANKYRRYKLSFSPVFEDGELVVFKYIQ